MRLLVDGTSLGLPSLLAVAQQNPAFFAAHGQQPSAQAPAPALSSAALLQTLAPLVLPLPPASQAFFVASSLFSSPTAASIANAQTAAAALAANDPILAAAAAAAAGGAAAKKSAGVGAGAGGQSLASLSNNTWTVTPATSAARYAVSASTTSVTSASPPVVWAGPLQSAVRVRARSSHACVFHAVPLTSGLVQVPFVLAWSVSLQRPLTRPRDTLPVFVHPPAVAAS